MIQNNEEMKFDNIVKRTDRIFIPFFITLFILLIGIILQFFGDRFMPYSGYIVLLGSALFFLIAFYHIITMIKFARFLK